MWNHDTGVASSSLTRVTRKTPLLRKATGNYLTKSTSREKSQSLASGFCCSRNRPILECGFDSTCFILQNSKSCISSRVPRSIRPLFRPILASKRIARVRTQESLIHARLGTNRRDSVKYVPTVRHLLGYTVTGANAKIGSRVRIGHTLSSTVQIRIHSCSSRLENAFKVTLDFPI